MRLGLDISTSIIGICILDDNGDLYKSNYIDLSKHKISLYKKAEIVKKHLFEIANNNTIDRIIIEEALLRFRIGKSSAHTISSLLRFNGVISYIVTEVFNIEPVHALAPHVRKVVGIVIDKKLKKKIGIKPIIIKHVINELGDKFPVVYTKTGKFKPYVADQADAWVLARADFIENKL